MTSSSVTPLHPHRERGFSLIELLVVILIIGILAAISLPALLAQRSAATSVQAKDVARTARAAMETYATDHNGSYSGAGLAALTQLEPALVGSNGSIAYLSAVAAPDASDFTVVATDPVTGEDFSVVDAAGSIQRICAPGGKASCPASGSW